MYGWMDGWMDTYISYICNPCCYICNPWASLIALLVKNPPALPETLVCFLSWEGLWRRDRLPTPVFLGFPGGSAGKESAGFDPWVGKIPWRRKSLPTPAFWPGEFHRLYSPWGCKELDTTEKHVQENRITDKRNMSSSRIHCCFIYKILSTEFKLSFISFGLKEKNVLCD